MTIFPDMREDETDNGEKEAKDQQVMYVYSYKGKLSPYQHYYVGEARCIEQACLSDKFDTSELVCGGCSDRLCIYKHDVYNFYLLYYTDTVPYGISVC